MSNSRDANVSFNVKNADQSKQEIDKIRQAAENFGDAGKSAAQGLVDAFTNVENASQRVTNKISDGRAVTVRDGQAIVQQMTILRQQLEQTFGSISNAPQAVQDAFAKAENQFKSTTATIRTLTTATTENKTALAGTANQWGGFEQQLLKMVGADGALGKMVIGFIGISAALTEGIQIGTKFATALGTNFDAAKEAAAQLRTSIGSVTNALTTDGLGAAFLQGAASAKNLTDTLFGTGLQMQGFNVLVGAGIERTRALEASTDDLRAVAYAHAEAVKGGAAAVALFNDVIRNSDPSEYAKKLDELKGKFVDLKKANDDATKAQKELDKEHDLAVKAIDAVIKKAREEIDLRKSGAQAVIDEAQKYGILQKALEEIHKASSTQEDDLGGATLSMRTLLVELGKMLPAYQQNDSLIQKTSGSLKQLITDNSSLTPEEKTRIENLQSQIAGYKNLDPAQRLVVQGMIEEIAQMTSAKAAAAAHAAGLDAIATETGAVAAAHTASKPVWDETTRTMTNTTVAVADHSVKLDAVAKTISNLPTPLDKAKSGFTDFGDSVKAAATKFPEADKMLGSIDQHLIDIATHARTATDEVNKLATAALALAAATAAAAGSGSSSRADSGGGGGGGWAGTSSPDVPYQISGA